MHIREVKDTMFKITYPREVKTMKFKPKICQQ